jgi:hypothetical protein
LIALAKYDPAAKPLLGSMVMCAHAEEMHRQNRAMAAERIRPASRASYFIAEKLTAKTRQRKARN